MNKFSTPLYSVFLLNYILSFVHRLLVIFDIENQRQRLYYHKHPSNFSLLVYTTYVIKNFSLQFPYLLDRSDISFGTSFRL